MEAVAALVDRGIAIRWRAVTRGLAQARWPGRFEPCPTLPRLWWDGAHNVSAAMRLIRQRPAGRVPAAIVLAFSRDKNIEDFLRVLHWDFGEAAIIATRTRSERAADPAGIAAQARALGFTAQEAPDVPAAVNQALRLAGEAPVLLTGSLFAVGEAMEAFGGAPGEML
jgi:dihydrofolate synthase/folylpolyglutamate synthase